MQTNKTHPWFEGSVLYQIYPRSFQDSNGDGIGDINGIRQRLDYLSGLGIDALWLSPFYPSPMIDFGYDVSDYCGVDPIFGTIEDFDALVEEAHALKLRVMIDLVPNHTSDQHPWFQESKSSKDNPKRDWYIWHDAKKDGSAPNNWISVFGGSAWTWDEATQQYYMHSFYKEQPDLNWENPQVQTAMSDAMRFWLDKGVDGFRVDAVDHMGKIYSFPDEPRSAKYKNAQSYGQVTHPYSRDNGNFFEYIKVLTDTVKPYGDRLLVLESSMIIQSKSDLYWNFYHKIDTSVCLPFRFDFMFMPWTARGMHSFLDNFQAGLRPGDHPVYVFGNHDQPRLASRIQKEHVRLGAMFLLTLPGLSVMYNGEEIGMENVDIPPELRQDPGDLANGGETRDNYRTPMQWSAEAHASFSSVTPWLPLHDGYKTRNVVTQEADTASLLHLYKSLIDLRRNSEALRFGTYAPGAKAGDIVSFVREYEGESILVILNMSNKPVDVEVSSEYTLVMTSSDMQVHDGTLPAHTGAIFRQKTS